MKEELFKAEMINHRLNEIERQLRDLEGSARDIQNLKGALDEWDMVPAGEEMLAPLARGIFVPAVSTAIKQVKVNVGQGLVVDKTVDEVKDMLDSQLQELHSTASELQSEFEEGLQELQKMETE